jgi:DNA mismatch endonuclease (patch repair protein)
MADIKSAAERSWNMSRIRSKDTVPEIIVRKELFARGFRYRLHGSRAIGSPDLVFEGRKVAVYVHGCFWHQHPGCKNAAKVRGDAGSKWAKKLKDNTDRDRRNLKRALESGYSVATIWECSLEPRKKHSDRRESTLDSLCQWLANDQRPKTLEL